MHRTTHSSPPLYVGGRRRPGPNLWGYDPLSDDLLNPRKRIAFKKRPPRAIEAFTEYWGDRVLWIRRRKRNPELRRRRMVVRAPFVADGPLVRKVVVYELKEGRKPRGCHRSLQQRALVAIGERADVGSGLAGLWCGAKFIRSLSSREWADIVGCSVRQWYRLVSSLKAADLIKGRQRRRRELDAAGNWTGRWVGCRRTLLLTVGAWAQPGVWGLRREYLRQALGKQRAARQAAEAPREHPPHAQPPADPYRSPELLRRRPSPTALGWKPPP